MFKQFTMPDGRKILINIDTVTYITETEHVGYPFTRIHFAGDPANCVDVRETYHSIASIFLENT